MIQFLKLVTGDELIAETTLPASVTDGVYTLKNPVRIAVTREGLGMMPFSLFVKEDSIKVKQEHVLFSGEPDDELRNAYNSKFGSGLVLPSSGMKIIE